MDFPPIAGVSGDAATVIRELVFAVLAGSETSEAVTVILLVIVLRTTLNAPEPVCNAASNGRTAFVSLEVMWATSVTVLTRFQNASTALTVTLNGCPAWRVV